MGATWGRSVRGGGLAKRRSRGRRLTVKGGERRVCFEGKCKMCLRR